MEGNRKEKDKGTLRRKFQRLRRRKKSAIRDEKVTENVLDWEVYRNSEIILAYFSRGSEVATIPILEAGLEEGKIVALPRVEGKEMTFRQVGDLDELRPGFAGLMEPTAEAPMVKSDSRETLILVPGLAFDKEGFRLGRGGGYYDRFLAQFNGAKGPPVTAGLAYEPQLIECLPREKHDRPVDNIVTEKKILSLR